MKNRRGLASFLCIVWCVYCVDAKDYITETKKYTPTCVLTTDDFTNTVVHYKSAIAWAKGHAIKNWKMGTWEHITSPSDARLIERGIVALKDTTVHYNTISYESGVSLNPVLKKIINTELPIVVHKEIFVVGGKMTIFVRIENTPVISYIYITNVMDINNPSSVVSSHFISHGKIPWYAKWAIGVMKREILKSVDEFDYFFLRNACASH